MSRVRTVCLCNHTIVLSKVPQQMYMWVCEEHTGDENVRTIKWLNENQSKHNSDRYVKY